MVSLSQVLCAFCRVCVICSALPSVYHEVDHTVRFILQARRSFPLSANKRSISVLADGHCAGKGRWAVRSAVTVCKQRFPDFPKHLSLFGTGCKGNKNQPFWKNPLFMETGVMFTGKYGWVVKANHRSPVSQLVSGANFWLDLDTTSSGSLGDS